MLSSNRIRRIDFKYIMKDYKLLCSNFLKINNRQSITDNISQCICIVTGLNIQALCNTPTLIAYNSETIVISR